MAASFQNFIKGISGDKILAYHTLDWYISLDVDPAVIFLRRRSNA